MIEPVFQFISKIRFMEKIQVIVVKVWTEIS